MSESGEVNESTASPSWKTPSTASTLEDVGGGLVVLRWLRCCFLYFNGAVYGGESQLWRTVNPKTTTGAILSSSSSAL